MLLNNTMTFQERLSDDHETCKSLARILTFGEHLGKTRFNDVVFNWKSLTPEIIDNTGKIINHINNGQVDYEVELNITMKKKISV